MRPPRPNSSLSTSIHIIIRIGLNLCLSTAFLIPLISLKSTIAQIPETEFITVFEDDFESGRSNWTTTDDRSWDWVDVKGDHHFEINKRVSDYTPKVRSPHNIALIQNLNLKDFVITFRVKSTLDTGNHRDCCVFFNYRDPEHFYYVHLGAKPDPASGQIMIVNGEARRPLTKNEKPVPWDDQWHQVKVKRTVDDGRIEVYFDDLTQPFMSIEDKTFVDGQIGIGSFDDRNAFDDVRVLARKDQLVAPKKVENPKEPPRPTPTYSDVAYGKDSARQVLDFWKANTTEPSPVVLLIHGGGWVGGDKRSYGNRPINLYLKAGISVAAINYRFIAQAMEQQIEPPVKACVTDAARALQFIRSRSSEWGIDPDRIGASGGSAGACTSLWLALHDDLMNPISEDLVERQSTRIQCAAVTGAQTSLDPTQLRSWIRNAIYGGHAFGFAKRGRTRPEEFELLIANREKVLPWIREYSPIELLSADDPPLFLEYPNQKTIPILGADEPDPTHSAIHGIEFRKLCLERKVPCDLVYPGVQESEFQSMTDFLIHHLKH